MDERRRSSHGKSSIAIVLGFRTHGVVKSHCAFRHSLRKNLFARVSLFQESTQSIVHSTALNMAPISFAKRWVKPEVRFRLAFSLYVAALRRRLFFGARWSVLGFGSWYLHSKFSVLFLVFVLVIFLFVLFFERILVLWASRRNGKRRSCRGGG